MGNSTVTPLQGSLLHVTQLDLLTSTTLSGTLYGIAFTLFCLYIHFLTPRLRDEDRKTKAKFMLAYSSVIMLCGLYNVVASAWVTQDAYIKHGNFPGGGPYLYEELTMHTPVVIIMFICQVVIDILTAAIQIWRVWVIWGTTRHANFIIVVPSMCLVSLLVLDLRTIVIEATVSLEELPLLDRKTQIAETAFQGSITILCTLSISLFLTFRHWQQRKLIGEAQGSTGYTNVVAMLIESYALESIWLLMEVIVTNHIVFTFFNESVRYIQTIAYLLVQYRVARGTAYESQRERSKISSLHWNHSNYATTQLGGTVEIHSGPQVPVKQEAPDASPV